MKRVEAVLCDFDDTLIDSSAAAKIANYSVAREIARDMHLTSPASTIRRLLTAIRETEEEMERSLKFNRNLSRVEVLRRVNAEVAASSEALRR